MNLVITVMQVIATLFVLAVGGWGVYYVIRSRKAPDDTSIDVSGWRPAPIIDTIEYGDVVPEHFEWETNTSGHATVRDMNGRLRTISPMDLQELTVVNMFQTVFGPGPAVIRYRSKDHAQQEQARYAAQAGGNADTMHYKNKFDMAQTDFIVERENANLQLEKDVERAQALIRANPALVKK